MMEIKIMTRKMLPMTMATLCALTIMSISSSAFALDGYADRRGLFSGIGLGGGVGLVESENGSTGIDQGRKLGMHMSAIVGGGASEHIVVGGEANWWARTAQIGTRNLSHHHLSFNAIADVFILDGFYLEGGGGLAYTIFDAERSGQQIIRYQELGLAVKGGAGFEFFVNSQVAIGMKMGYTRHFYSNTDFDTVAGGITLRWY